MGCYGDVVKMNRIEFAKGKQKAFLNQCINNLNLTSLRGLLQLGISTNYNNLKNYYSERRNIPEDLFQDLIYLAKIDIKTLDIQTKPENWGQIKGGKISKRNKNPITI